MMSPTRPPPSVEYNRASYWDAGREEPVKDLHGAAGGAMAVPEEGQGAGDEIDLWLVFIVFEPPLRQNLVHIKGDKLCWIANIERIQSLCRKLT